MFDFAIANKRDREGPYRPKTLGIEVTDTEIARRCGLGVIDPQHGAATEPDAEAAIEAACRTPVPPAGSRLITLRADLDAIGAMAVLSHRSAGLRIDAEMGERIARIAVLDKFDFGEWPGTRPLPRTPEDILADGIGAELGAMAAAVSDRTVAMTERVAAMRTWLSHGRVPGLYARAAQEQAARLMRSLELGATRVELDATERVTIVVSIEPGALRLGYRLAPVVVALNPAHRFADEARGRKFTLARWAEGDADLDSAIGKLAPGESGWGGQRGIKGSPQDRASQLDLSRVVAAVRSSLPENTSGRSAA